MALREVCDRCLKASTDGEPMVRISVKVDAPDGDGEAVLSVCPTCMPKVRTILSSDLLTKNSPDDVAWGKPFDRADAKYAGAFRIQPLARDEIPLRAGTVAFATDGNVVVGVDLASGPDTHVEGGACKGCGDSPCTCED